MAKQPPFVQWLAFLPGSRNRHTTLCSSKKHKIRPAQQPGLTDCGGRGGACALNRALWGSQLTGSPASVEMGQLPWLQTRPCFLTCGWNVRTRVPVSPASTLVNLLGSRTRDLINMFLVPPFFLSESLKLMETQGGCDYGMAKALNRSESTSGRQTVSPPHNDSDLLWPCFRLS